MKAIRTHEQTGISGLVFEEAPDPKPMFCEVLVKVAACGITHNELDWPIWTCRAGHQRTSVIPGHEVSGVVAALGVRHRRSPQPGAQAADRRSRARRGGAAGRPDRVAGPV
jgi:D-arabinose 1-dehydrogenase-like Zn-dependent alcohol dehydrogenase